MDSFEKASFLLSSKLLGMILVCCLILGHIVDVCES